MDVLAQVFEIAKTIYRLCDQAKTNRTQCERLRKRIIKLLLTIQTVEKNNKNSPALQIMAEGLVITLENAKSWVIKYSTTPWWRKIILANSFKEEFDVINERLVESSNDLLLQLSADIHLYMHLQFDRVLIQQENIEDMMLDLCNMKNDMSAATKRRAFASQPQYKRRGEDEGEDQVFNSPGRYRPGEDVMGSTRLYMRGECEDKVLICQGEGEGEYQVLNHPGLDMPENEMDDITEEDIRDMEAVLNEYCMAVLRLGSSMEEISGDALKLGELLLERERHCLYRGEYINNPVAIKVFKDHNGESEEHIRETFQNERESMKKQDCLSIVHLYGISIDNSGPETSYSLVMEMCSKGSLRDVLEREPDLTWEQKIRMAADVARAIYRILQAEEIIPSGSLSSTRFLVDETYCVKLSWISKTESYIKRISHGEITEKSGELDYLAPETPSETETYSKSSALYSLGVLMFEIAAGKRPFEGLEVTEENLAPMQEQWWGNLEDELPSSCPQIFQDLIKRLLQKNPVDRPSAGVVVDLLMSHLNKSELEKISAEASE